MGNDNILQCRSLAQYKYNNYTFKSHQLLMYHLIMSNNWLPSRCAPKLIMLLKLSLQNHFSNVYKLPCTGTETSFSISTQFSEEDSLIRTFSDKLPCWQGKLLTHCWDDTEVQTLCVNVCVCGRGEEERELERKLEILLKPKFSLPCL